MRTSYDWPSRIRERVLGSISTASASTGFPSSEIFQWSLSRSSPTVRSISPEGPVNWISNFMAGGPIAGDGLLASNGKVAKSPDLKRTDRMACPTALLAREQLRCLRRRRHGPPSHFHLSKPHRKANAAAIRRATWCEFLLEENRARRGCGGKGQHWS